MLMTARILAEGELTGAGIALQVMLLLLLILLSGTFSGSETVLFSLTRTQIEHAGRSHNPLWRQVAWLMRHPKKTLRTVLVANTAVNVLLFATSYVLFERLSGRFGTWIQPVSGVASILLVVVCGEVVPKVLAVSFADRVAPFSAAVVRVSGFVAGPIGRAIDVLLAEPFVRVVMGHWHSRRDNEHDLTTVELKTLLEMSRLGGAIRPQEDTFLRAVIDLGQLRVRDVMVPRVEITAFDVNDSPERLRELMRQTRFRKIPVYDGTRDEIVGLVYAKVLFFNPDKSLRELVSPVRFVPELITCEQLLDHFRSTSSQIAIAVDEHGGVAGLVTLEDVLEKIVGELHDPDEEPEEPEVRPLADGEYDISGQLSVHYWAETFGLPELADRVATLGGLVMARLGRPARVGDVVQLGNVELRVTRVLRRRIDRLHLRLLPVTAGGEA